MAHWRLSIAIAVSALGTVIGLSSDFLSLPCHLISAGLGSWCLSTMQGLPRKNAIIAANYRTSWRESLEKEFSEKAIALINDVKNREIFLEETAKSLQAKEAYLIGCQENMLEHEQRLAEILQMHRSSYEAEAEALKQGYEANLQQMVESFNSEIAMRQNTIAALQQRLAGTINRPDPKQGFAAWIAQMLLDALQLNEVFCIMKGFYKIPGLRDVSVWLELQPGQSARKLEAIAKEVGTIVKFGEPTITWNDDECIYEFRFCPNVVDSQETSFEMNLIEALVDNEGELPTIEEPENTEWFVETVTDPKSISYMVHGASGTGKSVLVDNLMCVAARSLNHEASKVNITIIDPKFPDSEWTYRGQRLMPQYRGWGNALDGVLAMQALVDDRLLQASKIAESIDPKLYADPNYKIPFPERSVSFWVVDEAAALHSRYKEECSNAFKAVLWVGRSAMVRPILVGQNPNVSNYGLQIPDMSNCTRFYIGAIALEALDKYIKIPASAKTKLKAEIYARLVQIKKDKMAGEVNPQSQFFSLVVMGNEPPFIAQLPKIKQYAFS